MAVAKEERGRGTFAKPVVILADMDKDEMDAAVADALGSDHALDVITRQGCPYDVSTLESIHAGKARAPLSPCFTSCFPSLLPPFCLLRLLCASLAASIGVGALSTGDGKMDRLRRSGAATMHCTPNVTLI